MYNNCKVSLMYKITNKWKIFCDNWFIKSLTVYIFSFIGNQAGPEKDETCFIFKRFFLFVCLFVWFFFIITGHMYPPSVISLGNIYNFKSSQGL